MKKFILVVAVTTFAVNGVQANPFNDAITSALDAKYTKKYDSWEDLGNNVKTVKGLMAANCESLEATWCKRMETSVFNIEPPRSRPENVVSRAGKACKETGGAYRTGYISRNTNGLASTADPIQLFLFENSEFVSRQDYHATAYYGVCSDNQSDKTLILSAGVGKKVPETNSAFALVQKGNTFIYVIDMAAQSQKFEGLSSSQATAESAFETCMAADLTPGNEVVYGGRKGMVVEMKAPVVQIQMPKGLKWVRLDDVTRNSADCRVFVDKK